jgi:outer membrane receptor for ferrienterochelin and colicins
MKNTLIISLVLLIVTTVNGQNFKGRLLSNGVGAAYVQVLYNDSNIVYTDFSGHFTITSAPTPLSIKIQDSAYEPFVKLYNAIPETIQEITLKATVHGLDEVVISANLKPVSKSNSPVNVEVYSQEFFKKNPTPQLFDAMQNVNGVRPQMNCSVCNTGDIHINGLEGAYTMVLIDGMPIVSGLSTVYGMFGIPNSLIERVEIIKGPTSSLYGSEAVAGMINIITKKAQDAPIFSADLQTTSWLENNIDLAFKSNVGKHQVLTGSNIYIYNTPFDFDNDNIADITLQQRASIFQKWEFHRKDNKRATFAARIFAEDRWGGEMDWTPEERGGTDIYGESIITKRTELLGFYQLPGKEDFEIQASINTHNQNSVYGDLFFLAQQNIAFGQLLYRKNIGKTDWLAGAAYRYTYYDDNTTATESAENGVNNPSHIQLPGVFVQMENHWKKHTLLFGSRYDYNTDHGSIYTPRFAYKFSPNFKNTFRINAGTGFRVVNLFTEDHAALTGAREVIVEEDLRPEESYNINLNYVRKFAIGKRFIGIDLSAWYTHFTNQIIPDYESNPNEIRYSNLNDDFSVTQGASMNLDIIWNSRLTGLIGLTYMDLYFTEDGERKRPLLKENYMGTWSISYKIPKINTTIDYTGNFYGPMLLPTLGPLDPRSDESPVWSIQNINITYSKEKSEFYCGVKNLLNWRPSLEVPFLIARANDPFDENVSFDANGNAQATANNPNALTFDPSYVYAANQGIRIFVGYRYKL